METRKDLGGVLDQPEDVYRVMNGMAQRLAVEGIAVREEVGGRSPKHELHQAFCEFHMPNILDDLCAMALHTPCSQYLTARPVECDRMLSCRES